MIKDFILKDTFARHCGIELIEAGEGFAKTKVTLADHHLNGLSMPHGGILFTLADVAFAAAANYRGIPTVAINVNISYLKSTESKVLYAEVREVNEKGRVGSYHAKVIDETGQIIAIFEGLGYRKSIK
ncbi:MAG: hotdog fold thioesterase [Anaerohalosphaeraceae bacterium]